MVSSNPESTYCRPCYILHNIKYRKNNGSKDFPWNFFVFAAQITAKYITILNRKSKITLSVINIDLDGFKNINDVYGHQEGDEVLKFFARRLEEVFGEIGFAIRWGGDEFILLLSEKRRERLEKYVKILNNKIDAYNDSNDKAYRIQFSCGIAIYDDSFDNVYEFIRHSDKLMYEEKQKKMYLKSFVKTPVSD